MKRLKLNMHKAKYYLVPAAVCLVVVLALGFYYFFSDFSQSEQTEYVYIDDDDTVDSVFVKLRPFATAHGMTGLTTLARHGGYKDHIRTGRFAIRPGESPVTLFRHLKGGVQEAVKLVVPESRTMQRLAGQLSRKLMLDSAQIAAALTDEVYCRQYGYDTATIACVFIPNTYEVYWNTSLDHLMERMQQEHDRFWQSDGRKAKADALGLTPNEVSTLASIVDEETSNQQEKPMVAGMYLNRLAKGMPLQADPTVKFAMKRFELRRIYRDMLFYDSPWNTYRNAGLPPGPIKVASVQGVDAVLNRAEHDYLYMCAKEDFSGTLCQGTERAGHQVTPRPVRS